MRQVKWARDAQSGCIIGANDFFTRFEAGALGDRMDFMEWLGLFQMAADLRKQLDELANEGLLVTEH